MNSKYQYLLKNTGILALSNFSSKILIVFLVPLYTSILTTQEYGVYDLVSTTVQLLFPVLSCNILEALMRFLLDKNNSRTEVVTLSALYLTLGILIGIVVFEVIQYFNLPSALSRYDAYILVFYISYTIYQFCIQLAKGLEKVRIIALASIVGTLSVIICNVLFLLVFNYGLSGYFMANITGFVVPSLYYLIQIKPWKYIRFYFNRQLNREMLTYCIPLIATMVVWWVNSSSDKYIVTYIVGVSANGILSIAYKIPNIMNTLQSVFIQAWQISAIRESDKVDAIPFYQNMFNYCMAFMCVGGSFLICFAKNIAELLYAKDFFVAWKFVPLLIVSNVLNSASGFIGPILNAKKDTVPMFVSAIVGAVSNIVLNIFLCKLFGIQGITIATMISSFIIFVVRKKFLDKYFQISNRSIFIFMSWLILILQSTLLICEVPCWMIFAMLMLEIVLYRNELLIVVQRVLKKLAVV
ncbi:O-antigen/teichoic acid export membrane protein [Fusobacterium naviforme]|uniref:O-antigen/teichoic acid export membrane protein n=1 Tax=Moryella indoligenes TaxID=371674 RepID=A0AAE3VBC5_9FIRM|nr:oligosaccharide flippase family protein [Moryella indoligenes]KAB0578512.1 oligosaccharide flippase family protein [Fusobacterium naviforme]MDQ0152992.1 O-antigen/teichoic acid export membrane protein [Moryella indoligenes]PSL11247.1 O-antigen/teichoic acid export membrane protein [Fusobacterium naviforme]STO28622.1 Polysaccharide biosynthesis protein [Fusobacterium naviforme]